MSRIPELLEKLPSYRTNREALGALSKFPLEAKRAEVYPHVIELAVQWWCVEEGKSGLGFELEHVVEFLAGEVAVAPELPDQLFAMIGDRPITLREHHFYTFVRQTRARGALRYLRGMWRAHTFYWADTVVALNGVELADDVLEALVANPMNTESEFATAAGLLAGERAIEPLLALFESKDGYCKDGFAMGLALARHDDEAFFKELGTAGEGANAKRLYAALHKPKQKDRLTALDAMGKEVQKAKTYIRPGMVLGCCLLLDDADPVIVERAAAILAGYAKLAYQHRRDVYPAVFLDRATAAIARGVPASTRTSLDAVHATIPHAPPFASGPVVAPPVPEAEKPSKKLEKGLAALATMRGNLPAKAAQHRDPALEAQIAEAPDDPARYLVYADWLQTKGDPRGTLIALHEAARKGDKTAESAAAALLVEQRHALLGLLDGVKEIELTWQLGFLRGARLKYPNQAKLVAGLEVLLGAESARFLQSIVIDPLERGKAPDPTRLVELILARAPKTLSHLQIGKPGKWTPSDELRAAFPRLERDPAETWNEVLAKIAEQKRLEIRYIDPKKLPLLVARSGKPDADPQKILVGLRAEVEKGKPIGIVGALPRVFTRESVDAFARALVEQWMPNDSQALAKFAFDCAGALGGDETAKLLGKNLATWSHARATQALDHLKRIGSDVALYQIVRLALLPGYQPRRDAADELLGKLAEARGGTTDDLMAELQPPGPDLEVQRAWLTRLIVHGPRIAADTFRRIATHGGRGPLAATLVWGTYAGKRELVETFAVARDGTLRKHDGSPFELGDERVGLVHPIEMSRELLETWRATFERRELVQAIPQLDRPTFRMSATDADTETLDWFAKRRAGFTNIQNTLLARDWQVYEQYDAGGTESFARWFARSQVFGIASFGTNMGAIAQVRVQGARHDRRRFSNVDAVTISELLYDLEVAHGYREAARGPAPSNAPDKPRASGARPVVERAKSGRSKCVVCEQAIAKGDPRVGVERMIQTDTFTGRGTVWAHPGCRDGMPELAGVDLEPLLGAL